MENEVIADKFEFVADILENRDANPYRVNAYRNAARTLRELDESVTDIYKEHGMPGLLELRGIGRSLARAIAEYVDTGKMSVLGQIGSRAHPVALIESLPGIGPELAQRIYDHLAIETLEELEIAARDGDLADVPGFGRKRLRGVIDALGGRLASRGRQRGEPRIRPPVEEILGVDREYREKAGRGVLSTIAPRRFNPNNESWLPILQTRRGNTFYTVLFSNTARAHELGKTCDWVVIYFETPEGNGQNTVVTQSAGRMAGQRVIRGRENECQNYYDHKEAA